MWHKFIFFNFFAVEGEPGSGLLNLSHNTKFISGSTSKDHNPAFNVKHIPRQTEHLLRTQIMVIQLHAEGCTVVFI